MTLTISTLLLHNYERPFLPIVSLIPSRRRPLFFLAGGRYLKSTMSEVNVDLLLSSADYSSEGAVELIPYPNENGN